MLMELNKAFGAVLLALLVALLSGFASRVLVAPQPPAQPGYVVQAAAGGDAAPAAAAAPAGPAPIEPLLAAANVEAGKAGTKACAACHTFDKGGASRVGPNLYGVVGGPHAHVDGFAYSDAMKSQGGVWDYEALNKFLANPKAAVPGTKMAFAGIRNDQDRANLIAYLRTLSDNPPPLP